VSIPTLFFVNNCTTTRFPDVRSLNRSRCALVLGGVLAYASPSGRPPTVQMHRCICENSSVFLST